jgi:Pentapeptide repeats (8 copies)
VKKKLKSKPSCISLETTMGPFECVNCDKPVTLNTPPDCPYHPGEAKVIDEGDQGYVYISVYKFSCCGSRYLERDGVVDSPIPTGCRVRAHSVRLVADRLVDAVRSPEWQQRQTAVIPWGSIDKKVFDGELLSEMDFTDAKIVKSTFVTADLRRALFRNAVLDDSIMDRARLEAAKFNRAAMHNCSFVGASADDADFSQALIYGTTWRNLISNQPQWLTL